MGYARSTFLSGPEAPRHPPKTPLTHALCYGHAWTYHGRQGIGEVGEVSREGGRGDRSTWGRMEHHAQGLIFP
jgi:hypothetical protein